MQLIVQGNANLGQMQAEFAALTAQVEALNKAMARSSMIPAGGNANQFARTQRAAQAASGAYNAALTASGAYRVEQMKINDQVAKHTELLERQKLGFNQVFGKKAQAQMRAVYREQLALRRASAMTMEGGVGDGKQRISLGVPTEVHRSWDTLNNRVGMFGAQLSSASAELVNWGKNTQWAGRQLMVGLTLPVVAFGAAAGVMAYQVDKQMTRIAKVYDTTANANSTVLEDQMAVEKELNQLREAGMVTAQKAATAYGSAITDTLEVQAELAATGQTGTRLQESTNQVMRIATLGEIEHADATKALISLQSVLGHTVKQTADDFNYMNSIENATSLSTNDFVTAIPRALGPMQEMGGTLQDLAILMVAMKERGIEAGEGANAIKAMMQRLYRPSQQVREEWQQIAKVDPLKFVEESGGNVMEILPKIAEATRDLEKADRVKLLAGLFGTYQVTRMSAMLKGLDDMNKGIGQTSRVVEVNAQSWEDWGATAERELAQQAESASGKFKRAVETVKAELASLGEPFLEVASNVLGVVGAVLKFVNSMPDWVKKGLMFAVMLGAIIGPVVMLIGLFANFAGSIGRFAGWILKLTTGFNILNRGQVAADLTARAAAKGFMTQATAAELLNSQVQALNASLTHYATSMAKMAGVPGMMPALGQHGPGITPYQRQMAANMASMKSGNSYKAPAGSGMGGQFIAASQAQHLAQVKLAEQHMAASGLVARNASATEKATAATLKSQAAQSKITNTIAGNMHGAAVSGGVMALAMGTMMLTSNETANSIAKWALIGSIVVPAMKGLYAATAMTAKAGWSFAASQIAAGRAVKANALGVAATAGKWRTAAGVVTGLGKGVLRMLGPVGMLAAGALAIGGIWYKTNKDNEEALKEQIELQKALTSSTEDWASILGVGVKKRKELNSVSDTPVSDGGPVEDQIAAFKESNSGKAIIAKLQDDNVSQTEKDTIALSQYLAVLRETNGSVRDAQRALEIMFRAAGDGAVDSQEKALAWAQEWQGLDIGDMGALWNNQLRDAMSGISDAAGPTGTEIGKILVGSLGDAANEEQRAGVLNAFMDSVAAQWDTMLTGVSEETRNVLSDLDIDSSNLNLFMADFSKNLSGEMDGSEFLSKWGLDDLSVKNIDAYNQLMREMAMLTADSGTDAENLAILEASVVKQLALRRGITGEILTMQELMMTWEMRILNATKARAPMLFAERVRAIEQENAMRGLFGTLGKATDEQKLMVLNQIRMEMGLSKATSLAQGWTDETRRTGDEISRIKNDLNSIGNISFKVSAEEMKGILQEGMSAVQDTIAGRLSDSFDADMQAGIDANEDYWSDRIDAMQAAQENATDRLENSQERETRAFENRWERRRNALEKSYDARIEGVEKSIEAEQKAEEIRQRIFDAEQSRLDRLAESANRGIDFNLALQTGDLDEAAKIRNDMDAAAQSWALADGADAGSRASERRQEKMQDRADRLGERKDRALEALEKREEAERRSMERRQEAEQEHLEKVQEMNLESLNAQADAAKEVYQQDWENRKDSLDAQLEMFKSFVPKNQKQLEAWMKEMDITYTRFGDKTLDPKSKEWANFFKTQFKEKIRAAGLDVASANYWEGMGNDIAKKTLLGMGFGSMGAFKKFVMTGEIPQNFGQKNNQNKSENEGSNLSSDATIKAAQGGASGSVHKSMSQTHRSVMGGAAGPAGMTAAVMGKMFGIGLGKAFRNVFDTTQAKSAVQAGTAAISGFMPGTGQRTHPIAGYSYGSIHGTETGYPAVDFAAPTGTPVRAVANGVITRSYDIRGPLSTDSYRGDGPYGSYGRVVYLKTDAGPEVLMAHLSRRSVVEGQRVTGGSTIGYSGNTGNSSGPHLHFGATNGPLAWLKSGGRTLNDGMAMLHRGETVLTEPLSDDLKRTVQAFGRLSSDVIRKKKRGIDPSEANMWGPETTKADPFRSTGFWTWVNSMPFIKKIASVDNEAIDKITDTGAKAMIRLGTLNTQAGTAAADTQSDLSRLIGRTDFLALTEVTSKFASISKWLAQRNWGMLGKGKGIRGEAMLAYNKNTQALESAGMRKLGDKTNNSIVGGPMKRYANYGLFTDRASGRKTWQVAAHTVPTPYMDKRHRELFYEQWGNLDNLVEELRGTGAPVFVSGDLNNNPSKRWWRTPAGLKEYRGMGVDWIFGDPKMSKALGMTTVGGMHTDHAGAVLANFALPSHKNGAENIRWDNTLVNMHKRESILTSDQSDKFRKLADNIDNVASGGNVVYDVDVNVTEPNASADDIAQAVIVKLRKEDARKPRSRR